MDIRIAVDVGNVLARMRLPNGRYLSWVEYLQAGVVPGANYAMQRLVQLLGAGSVHVVSWASGLEASLLMGAWLGKHGFFSGRYRLDPAAVRVASSRKAKAEEIARIRATHAVDDRFSVLETIRPGIERIAFDPTDEKCEAHEHARRICHVVTRWEEVFQVLGLPWAQTETEAWREKG